jgi:polyferredoxin
LFVRLSDGSIRNDYEFKILNMEPKSNTFELRLEGVEGASMRVTGHQDAWVDRVTLPVAGNTVGEFRIFVKVPRENIKSRSSELEFVLVNVATGEEVDYDTLFAAP